jgi:hypothetical protein
MGRLPILSDRDPITGSQRKFEAPTPSVTIMVSLYDKRSTVLPNVGVYAVIM